VRNNKELSGLLSELLCQPEDDFPFVVVEEHASGKFVQFGGSATRPLFLDLPWQTLSEIEFYRAVAYFQRMGVAGAEEEMLDAPGGKVVGTEFTFQMSFRTVDAAVVVASAVFEEVYQFPSDKELSIKASWLD